MVLMRRATAKGAAALVVLLSLASVPGTATGSQVPARVIEVTAERFEFWPSEITVDAGEDVELRVRSEDTNHGFRIVGTNTNLLVPKRGKGVAAARIKVDQPGRYTIECNRMCGAGHHFMRAVLVVRERPAGSAR